MAKQLLLGFLFLFSSGIVRGQSVYGYNPSVNGDNILVAASLSFNSTGPLVKPEFGWSNTAKGALSTVPAIGIFYHKSIGDRLSVRFGFSFGYTSNAFKYATTYDSLTPNYTPMLTKTYDKYVKVKTGTSYVQPQIDLGYIFGPIKDMYLIEVRAGVGFQASLGKSSDSINVNMGTVNSYKRTFTYKYGNYQSSDYGNHDAFGSLVSNLYVGMRWQKTTNEFLNRFSIGLQATLPVSYSYAGYALIEYKNASGEVFSREKVYFSQCSFGVKAAINLLP